MNKRIVATHLTLLDLASLDYVAAGAPAGSAQGPVDGIGPRVREEIGADGETVLVRIWY